MFRTINHENKISFITNWVQSTVDIFLTRAASYAKYYFNEKPSSEENSMKCQS